MADAIDVIRPSVVQISVTGDLAKPIPIGTGFIIDSAGYVLTARHVIRDGRALMTAQRTKNCEFLIGLAIQNTENVRASFNLLKGNVIEEDPRHDLALLRMQPNPFDGGVTSGIKIGDAMVPLLFAVATRSSDRPRDGLSIAVSGYPLNETVLITTSGALASAWAMNIEEIAIPGAPAGVTRPDIKDSYLADVSVNPGNSGGPVYRISDGAVVGVCVAFRNVPLMAAQQPVTVNGQLLSYNSGLSIAVPISYGEELLTRHLSAA